MSELYKLQKLLMFKIHMLETRINLAEITGRPVADCKLELYLYLKQLNLVRQMIEIPHPSQQCKNVFSEETNKFIEKLL